MSDDKLKFLGQTAVEVPQNVAAVVAEYAATHQALTSAFSDQLYLSGSADFAGQFAAVQTNIEQFSTETQQATEELTSQIEEVEQAMEELSTTLADESNQMTLELESIKSELATLGSTVMEETERFANSFQDAHRAHQELQSLIETRVPFYVEHFESTEQACEALRDSTVEAQENLENKLAEFDEAIDERQGDLDTAVEQFGPEVDGATQGLCDHLLEQSSDRLADGVSELGDSAHEMINQTVVAGIDGGVQQVVDLARDLREAMTRASEETSNARETVRPLVQVARSTISTLDDLIDMVRDVAATFSVAGD